MLRKFGLSRWAASQTNRLLTDLVYRKQSFAQVNDRSLFSVVHPKINDFSNALQIYFP